MHLAILVLIVLLLFGAKRVPEVGRSLGQAMRGFKESIATDTDRQLRGAVEASTAHTPMPSADDSTPHDAS